MLKKNISEETKQKILAEIDNLPITKLRKEANNARLKELFKYRLGIDTTPHSETEASEYFHVSKTRISQLEIKLIDMLCATGKFDKSELTNV